MNLPRNAFLEQLQSGKTLWGCWLGLPDPNVAEIAANAGFDWLLIDHEHAPFELSDVMAHLRAMAPYPVAPIVRPVNGDPALLKKFLEMGVQTFIVPMVDTPEQAQACVDAVYYPPEGRRGVGTALARASHWNQVPDYLHHANEEICLIVQAETVTAIENLDAILALGKVHGVFIGPSDLAASMGKIGQGNDPELIARCIKAIRKIKAAGKIAGILTAHDELIQQSAEAGANFIGIGVDTLLLGEALRQRAASRP